jgi:DNA-binding SARP family transcriptional activator
VLYPGGRVEIDVDAFEAGSRAPAELASCRIHRAALELHGGELLPEDRYETWASAGGRR